MTFTAKSYGKKVSKVLCGAEVIFESVSPDGTAYASCKKLADRLNRMLDDALFKRGDFKD
jgi:hypothetical protein